MLIGQIVSCLDIYLLQNIHISVGTHHLRLLLGMWIFNYYLLTYVAITTCYRSWPQLICGAIRHELLQVGANFGYPAFLDSHQPVWPNAVEAVLVCAILLYCRKVHKSYVGFSCRRRLMPTDLKISTSRSQHHKIKPAIWETWL